MNIRKGTVLFVGVVGGLLIGGLAFWQPWLALGLAVAVPLFLIALRWPPFLLYGALASIALGQVGRIPPLHGGAPLIADGLLAGFFLTWLVWAIWKKMPLPRTPAHLAWYGFLAVALLSLVFTPYHLSRGEFMNVSLYWVRLTIYSSLIWILPSLYQKPAQLRTGYRVIAWTGMAVLVLGALQLALLPDIGMFAAYGWDPHVGRFVSTFLDPNYLGGYLALLLVFFFALNREKPRPLWALAMAMTVVAGVLTYSRSGYLALAVVVVILGLSYSWRLFLLIMVMVIPLSLSIPRVAQRVEGGFSIDQTSRDRIDSWGRALMVINHNPILGVGYNNYDIAQKELNMVSPIGESQSSAGSDSSLLNVMATTGVVGFALFLLAGMFFLRDALRIIRRKEKNERRVAAYVVLIATPALLVNAMFVNALFYPLIMIVYTFFIGALYVAAPESSSGR